MTVTKSLVDITAESVRAILTREAETKLAWKLARARAYLDLVTQGWKYSDAWQKVQLLTESEERDYLAAQVEYRTLWIISGRGMGIPGTDDEGMT